ncbi:MAG: hypothetical protein IJA00_05250 [Bacteroidaceae bacterium]|nr:hypothetical protein [Bacteroidaceae bacterium]
MKVLRVLDIAASLSLGFASSLLAQDVLITQEGDAHKVYEIDVSKARTPASAMPLILNK